MSGAELFGALADGGDRPALIFPERTLSYAELARETHGPALRARFNRRVAVLAEPRIETAIAVVGALRGGSAVVPINPRSGSSELAHIVADAAPTTLFLAADADVPEGLAGVPAMRVGGGPPAPITVTGGVGYGATDDTPALIVYTSGTTGPPKGAILPARAIASNLDALARVWDWTADDVVAHGLPLFHVHGLVIGILGPLRRGGTARHIGRFDPAAIGRALDEDATMVFGVPTMYRRLADAAAQDAGLAEALGRARLLVSGSAALPAAEHARLRELTGRTVVERYGMTETLMITAVPADASPAAGATGSVGPPLPGVEVRLIDDVGAPIAVGAPVPDGEAPIGEVQLRGPNVFLGYLNRPDATAEAMHDGWFATGDMAVWTTDGALRLVGRRATDLIKSGGYKIGAGEIEAALREHPGVEDAAVTGAPDADLGERVVAWVVLRGGRAASADELADHVTSLLAPHKRPRDVHFLDALPRNELGKVQKRRLELRPSS